MVGMMEGRKDMGAKTAIIRPGETLANCCGAKNPWSIVAFYHDGESRPRYFGHFTCPTCAAYHVFSDPESVANYQTWLSLPESARVNVWDALPGGPDSNPRPRRVSRKASPVAV